MKLEDEKIIELYFARDEKAISETSSKYGSYCLKIALNILGIMQDSEECVNDTWLKTWNSIPPQRPRIFSAFLAKITRNLAINRFNYENAKKRSAPACAALDELDYCIGEQGTREDFDRRELERIINSFVSALDERERNIFIRRYFFSESTPEISEKYGIKESYVLTILSRTRKKLKAYLVKEGVFNG